MVTRLILFFLWLAGIVSAAPPMLDERPLELPEVGSVQLRVLAPALLELTRVTTKDAEASLPAEWDFVNDQGECRLPGPDEFAVTAGVTSIGVEGVGFRRRVIYADFKHRDLRIGNYLYLRLAAPVPDNLRVEVKNPNHRLWPATMQFAAVNEPLRWSPVLHVNQTGY